MRWLWLAISIVSFAVAFRTHSMGLAALCLLVGLGCMLMFILTLASSRIESSGRDASTLMGPEEIRKMRESIERKKREGGPQAGATGGHGGVDHSVALDGNGDVDPDRSGR
jgi:hypothetical protein